MVIRVLHYGHGFNHLHVSLIKQDAFKFCTNQRLLFITLREQSMAAITVQNCQSVCRVAVNELSKTFRAVLIESLTFNA